jgi:hypothetical protein
VGASGSVDGWGLVAERAVSPAVVVVVLPVSDHHACRPSRPSPRRPARGVVAAQHGWVPAGQCEAVQFVDQRVGGDAALDQAGEALLLVGSDDEILTAIRQRQQRWGINRLVIREDAIDKLAPLLPHLHETTE